MNRREWVKQSLMLSSLGVPAEALDRDESAWSTEQVRIDIRGSEKVLWTFAAGSHKVEIAPPSFPIDGVMRSAALTAPQPAGPARELGNGIFERRFIGPFAADPTLSLELVFRIARNSPVVRFRYVLHAPPGARLTGDGAQLSYLSLSFAGMTQRVEVQLSAFNDMLHSYTVAELPIAGKAFEDESRLIGPIVAASNQEDHAFLIAYEHGAQVPDCFLEFHLDTTEAVSLKAAKANYIPGQTADGFATVWMQATGSDKGLAGLAAEYRQFILRGLSIHAETRRPYVFYNTWNLQERNRWFHGKPYLSSMNPERILAEIEVAHRLGIDVFVMDTGWYEKTGDWEVSRARFPNLLTDIKNRLDQYGMKLGLWFDPTAAAKSSRLLSASRDCVRTVAGKEGDPHAIWETEESYAMCLVSRYSDAFADTLVRVAKETGARYFKWDAIGQYGCDSPDHWHGTVRNTRLERWNSYAFQLPQQMARVAEKVAAAVPDIIIDFDVTEGGRALGLSFLAAGKYFLINNGPYLFNYDLPLDREHQNWNLFFYPGPARTWICRSPLTYDKWIPSILFLTHYFPDDPESSQSINVASLILGQNGMWGDLVAVSSEGVDRIGQILRRYKTVREDITASNPIVTGSVGSSPEIHEKVLADSGRGAVVLFATAKGKYRYVTANRPHKQFWTTAETKVRYDARGRAIVEADFASAGAAIVFFGAGS